ncbi:MAG TPA: Ig-like domain-containing protein [Thermoanaerobaculaceae bacterium]|nr:Ig-like domain-containing protein [Thermoanaerobaculaceae bacterium]
MNTSRTPLIAVLLLAAGAEAPADPPATPIMGKLPPAAAPSETLEPRPAFGAVGATVILEATLTGGATPIAGRKVSFAIKGHGANLGAGSATTDASGRAKVTFTVPELAQESYQLLALAEAGPGRPAPVSGRAGFGVFKADVDLRVFETARPHPKPGGGAVKSVSDGAWVKIVMTRTTDSAEVARSVRVLLDGQPYTQAHTNSSLALPNLPASAAIGSWKVEVIFDGDGSYLGKTARATIARK